MLVNRQRGPYRAIERMTQEALARYSACNALYLHYGREASPSRLRELTPDSVTWYSRDLYGNFPAEAPGRQVKIANPVLAVLRQARQQGKDPSLPVVITGVTVFSLLTREQALQVLSWVPSVFPRGDVLLDLPSQRALEQANAALGRFGSRRPQMQFAVEDGDELAGLANMRLVDAQPFLSDQRRVLQARAGGSVRLTMGAVEAMQQTTVYHLTFGSANAAKE